MKSRRSPLVDTKSADTQRSLLSQLGLDPDYCATAEQIHRAGVGVVSKANIGLVPRVDALVTDIRGLPLLIRSADCVTVFLFDPVRPAIGLVHSGKEGTRCNVVAKTLQVMQHAYQTTPKRCHAFLGPSIGPCHYEIDLWAEIERQLMGQGVTNIDNPHLCTACHLDRYYSYRAERGQTGRMLAVLALK